MYLIIFYFVFLDVDSRVLDGREKQILRIENYEREEEEKEELESEEGERKRRGGEGERGEGRRRGRLSNQLKLQELTQTNINIRNQSINQSVSLLTKINQILDFMFKH